MGETPKTALHRFSEDLFYVKKKRNYTKRLARKIVQQVLGKDFNSVAKNQDVSEQEIETMLKDIAQEKLPEKPSNLKRLGIDEIALVKGQGNYCAVLVDIDSGKLLDILDKRTKEELTKKLLSWGEKTLNKIKEVSIDLCKIYKNLVSDLMPKAEIIADRFHVTKQVNEELDSRRKTEKKIQESREDNPEKSAILTVLKNSKYALLKNESDLSETQKEKLESVKAILPTLGKMHEFKEQLRAIFESTSNWVDGLFKIADWLSVAHQYFPKSKKTIIRWIGEIIGYFDNRTTNGVVEGINNKLKLIKRAAYGFRNFENFKRRSLLCWYFDS